jgi:hypothetical protein
MNDLLVSSPRSAIPSEVQAFAAERGISGYLDAVIELARQAFPSSTLAVSLAQDAEDETHQYIAFDVDVQGRSPEELLVGQRTWSLGMRRVCPSQVGVYFVLGLR